MDIIFTIGFTKKSAEEFFKILRDNSINHVADIRLNNRGQLAGYTKEKDLIYFLSLFQIRYAHWTDFAPTKEIRDRYRSDRNFDNYKRDYLTLLENRQAVSQLDRNIFAENRICLLCSESEYDKCHRRLAAEAIAKYINNLEIIHL